MNTDEINNTEDGSEVDNVEQDKKLSSLPKEFKRKGGVIAMCFSPKGDLVVSTDGSEITLWETKSGRRIRSFITTYFITSIAFSPKDDTIAVGDANGRIHMYNIMSGKVTQHFSG